MKIVDVISESTNEGLGSALAKGGAWLLGKGDRAQAIEKLASAMAASGRKLSAKEANRLVGKELAQDAKLMADAEQLAIKKIADAKYAANVAAIRASLGNVADWANKLKNVYLGYMFVAPLMTYYNNMQAAQKLLDSGQATADDFEKYHRREMAVLIGKWASIIVANWAGQKPGKWLGSFFGMFSKRAGSFFTNIVGTGGGLAAVALVSNKEVAQDIANFMASSIFGQAVGYLGAWGEDALLGFFSDKLRYGQQGTGNNAGQGGNPATTAQQDIDASSQGPTGTGSTANTGQQSQFDRPLFKDFK